MKRNNSYSTKFSRTPSVTSAASTSTSYPLTPSSFNANNNGTDSPFKPISPNKSSFAADKARNSGISDPVVNFGKFRQVGFYNNTLHYICITYYNWIMLV